MKLPNFGRPRYRVGEQNTKIGQLHDDDIWLQLPEFIFGFALLFKFVNPAED